MRKQVVFFSLNAFGWFFLVAFLMVPHGGELQIWLHKQVIAFDFFGRHVELSLALLVPPHGWIDGLLDVDGLFVTTLAVTQFSKLLSSFVLPWLRVKCTRAFLGCTQSARRRTRAVLRALRQNLRRCGDCDFGLVGRLCCARRRARASPLPPARARRGAPLPAASTAVRIRARPEGEAPSPPCRSPLSNADEATARRTARRRSNSELEHQAEAELVERYRGLDNTVPYEGALFELVTAALLRRARPLDSLVLLAEVPTSHAAAAPGDAGRVASSAPSNARRGSSSCSPRERGAALRARSSSGASAGGMRALDVWEQARRVPFDEASSYIALVLQFGYVTLFTVAWPLAPLCAVLHNAIQSRIMFSNLCVSTRRPAPRIDNGAAAWVSSLSALHTAAGFVVAALITFATGQLEAWLGCVHHHEQLHAGGARGGAHGALGGRGAAGVSAFSGERMAPVRACFEATPFQRGDALPSWALRLLLAIGGGWACRLLPLVLLERASAVCVWCVRSGYPAMPSAAASSTTTRARRAQRDLEDAVAPAMIAHRMEMGEAAATSSAHISALVGDGAAKGGSSTNSGIGGATPRRAAPRGRLGTRLAAATAFRQNVRRIFDVCDADADGGLSRNELAAFIDAVRAATPRAPLGGDMDARELALPARRVLTTSEHATLFRELKLLPDADGFELELAGEGGDFVANALGFNELVAALVYVDENWAARELIGAAARHLLLHAADVARAVLSAPPPRLTRRGEAEPTGE